jgi:hypothetical protein
LAQEKRRLLERDKAQLRDGGRCRAPRNPMGLRPQPSQRPRLTSLHRDGLPARRHQVCRPHVPCPLELRLEARMHCDHEPLHVRGGHAAAKVNRGQHRVDGAAQLVEQACGADVDEEV